jgi:hypothetical protein
MALGDSEKWEKREATLKGLIEGPQVKEKILLALKIFHDFLYEPESRPGKRYMKDWRLTDLHFLADQELHDVRAASGFIEKLAEIEQDRRRRDRRRDRRLASKRRTRSK